MEKYYIKQNGNLKEVTKDIIDSLGEDSTYGVLDKDSGHIYERHSHCTELNCNICDGGLSHCLQCGGAEASLTSECCGRQLTEEEDDGIMACNLEYKYGRWFTFESKCSKDYIAAQLQRQHDMLSTLANDNAANDVLAEAYMDTLFLKVTLKEYVMENPFSMTAEVCKQVENLLISVKAILDKENNKMKG